MCFVSVFLQSGRPPAVSTLCCIGPVFVMAARAIVDIDRRVEHIATQVSMGSDETEVVAEQYKELLRSFSMIRGVDLAGITRISRHLVQAEVFSSSQLSAFSGCLRAAASAVRLDKPAGRQMQSNLSVEHCFLQHDWDRLFELGKKPKEPIDSLEDVIAIRLICFRRIYTRCHLKISMQGT